jgi:hypothetical protein
MKIKHQIKKKFKKKKKIDFWEQKAAKKGDKITS